jgi:hypothetical protein
VLCEVFCKESLYFHEFHNTFPFIINRP